jgi:hypothetical protein
MSGNHIAVGMSLICLTLVLFIVLYFQSRKQASLRLWGWTGLAIILLAESCLFLRVRWVSIYFTPLTWTGYLLFIDALVWTLQGRSRLAQAPREFLWLAFWSVPLWLLFEAYNLRLHNWTYVGLPHSSLLRDFGYLWSFATIWPAIHETADFVHALGLGREEEGKRHLVLGHWGQRVVFVLGLVLVTVPVLVPRRVGSYLFGAIWLGFALLLDPVNHWWGGHSVLRDLERGRSSAVTPFLVSGLVCGLLWEFWNYWAGAKWLYIFPIWQHWKVFEMPLPGFLGFPPFALECFVVYEFLRTVRKQLGGLLQGPRWEAEGSPL